MADILALQGSPRRGGNTDRLLENVLEGAREKGGDCEKIVVRDLKISPCLEIGQCYEKGTCAIRDDMDGVYEKLISSSAVIVASPIFFYGPSAHIKALIDRCQALWARKYSLNLGTAKGSATKGIRGHGYVVSAAATRGKKLFDGLLLTTRYFFDVLDLEPAGELLVRGVDAAGDVLERPEALDQARKLGAQIVSNLGSGAVER